MFSHARFVQFVKKKCLVPIELCLFTHKQTELTDKFDCLTVVRLKLDKKRT